MSLKTSHLILVIMCIVACCAYGMWCVVSFMHEGGTPWLLAALLPVLGGLGLLLHGVVFYKHTEDQPWL